MSKQTVAPDRIQGRRASQRGAVLIVVIVLSSIALAVMTTLLYIVTMGSQLSGVEKRYRTAHDAGLGGAEIVKQLIGLRGNATNTSAFVTSLNTNNILVTSTTPTTCSGTTTSSGETRVGWAAKVLTPTWTWSSNCDRSVTIDPSNAVTYDYSLQLGATGNRYMVYAKVIRVTSGNTTGDAGGSGLWLGGVVTTNADVQVSPMPFLYSIEIDAENAVNRNERAKFSLVYQY